MRGPTIATSEEVGILGIRHLRRLWSRSMAKRAGASVVEDPADWVADNVVISGLGLGLQETISHLFLDAPTFEQFEDWVMEMNGGAIPMTRIDRMNAAIEGRPIESEPIEPVLTESDLRFWEENGYVIVPQAASRENCAAAIDAICEFLEIDLAVPDTWYRRHSIWVPLLRCPAFWANRNSPRIFNAFAQLWGRTDLWVTVDQGGMNPPERPGWTFPGPHLHWDTSLELPIPFGLQGILYLADTDAHQGAFTCVPGFHRRIESWLRSLPEGADPRQQDLQALGAAPIAAQAGDLIIWHHALPHGSSPNRAAQPRFVQYVSLYPNRPVHNPVWK